MSIENITDDDGKQTITFGHTVVEIAVKNLNVGVETEDGGGEEMTRGSVGMPQEILESAEVYEIGTIFLTEEIDLIDEDAVEEAAEGDEPVRSAGDDSGDTADTSRVNLTVPDEGGEHGRAVLYIDEGGGVTIHFPVSDSDVDKMKLEEEEKEQLRGGDGLQFVIPMRDVPAAEVVEGDSEADLAEGEATRGVVGIIGRKMLKIIAWKVGGMLVEEYGPKAVRLWETNRRPMRIVGRDTLFVKGAPKIGGLLPASGGAKTLLFIHGTFSRIASGFGGVDQNDAPKDADPIYPFLDHLKSVYEDRIYGYDHPTVASGIATNVMHFFDQLGPGKHCFDIVAHSRGGVLTRAIRDVTTGHLTVEKMKQLYMEDAARGNYADELIQWGHEWKLNPEVEVEIGKIVLSGATNAGTDLVDGENIKQLIEILLTATNVLPDGVDLAVDALLEVIKILATGEESKLPGLDDQKPGSDFLAALNGTPGENDYIIRVNTKPNRVLLRMFEQTWDKMFRNVMNDLVVPYDSVGNWHSGDFKPGNDLSFKETDSIWHCSIFSDETTQNFVKKILTS